MNGVASVEPAVWYQIHTNGATTTFARYYRQDDGLYRFQKLAADHTAEPTGFAEIFGDEVMESLGEVSLRMTRAIVSKE